MLARIDAGLHDIKLEVRGLRTDHQNSKDPWLQGVVWFLLPIVVVVLMLCGIAAAEAVDVLRTLR
jgi:hypothetical protein